ncbi:peroxidase 16 precursor [Zea mays]|uniref:Peroxidase n=1 Tax=Zea mays TaxID=4577 RepID=A0A1D6GUF7_MAIZE|nr:peroxidase 16 precursor [Zea mays]AQK66607.1 Peroxidase 16 [Zea mays]|eukprot:NP_001151822.2 peroxidase 16 precursor [Zea mays]
MRRLQFLAAAAAAIFLLALPLMATAQPKLRPDYYAGVCPNLESIVRGAVRQSVALSPLAAPATLRLFFHDCAVRGCDASVMLIDPAGGDEWRSPDGVMLKPEGFSTVMSAKAAVDSDPQCRNMVSCADILALAARDSVFLSGGPDYEVELGRFDGRVSSGGSVVVPHGTFDLDQLNAFFSSLGLSQTDMIALSGGHTIGAASCGSFAYRVGADPAMDPALAQQVLARCPGGGPAGFAFLDATTPLRFDNEYYRNLLGGMGILASDQVLYADPRSRGAVERYAADQAAFFGDFAAAMTRLGRVGVRTAADGEIRRDCRFPNPN